MSQRYAGSFTRCTRANAFPVHIKSDDLYFSSYKMSKRQKEAFINKNCQKKKKIMKIPDFISTYNILTNTGLLPATNVPNFCCNDELSLTMSWVACLLTDLELFILLAENSQILLKLSVIPILLTFMYLVALNLLVNNQLNSLSNSTHHCGRS